MRLSILTFESPTGVGVVLNPGPSTRGHLERELRDRVANKESFPGERVTRLPRRMSRAIHARAGWFTDSIDIRRTLREGRVLDYGEEVEHPQHCNCSDCDARLSYPYLPGY